MKSPFQLLLFILLFLSALQLSAQETENGKKQQIEDKVKQLTFSFFQYTWLTGSTGELSAADERLEINENFVEVFENLASSRAGGSLISGSKMNWGGFSDNVFLNLDLGQEVVAGDTFQIRQRIFYSLSGPYYRAVLWEDLQKMTSLNYRLIFFPFLGARYTFMVNNFENAAQEVQQNTNSWVEPVLGSMATFRLINNGRLMIILMGNVGGFGAGSDFSWESWAMLGMELGKNGSAHIGYRAIGQNYSSPQLDDPFEYDMIIHGVWASIEFRFFY